MSYRKSILGIFILTLFLMIGACSLGPTETTAPKKGKGKGKGKKQTDE